MAELNPYSLDVEPPTLYEVLQAARDFGLVGERDTVLTLVLSMIRGHLVVMTGLSRAGKDVTVDAAEATFPGSMVYHWPVDDSETAAYYNRGTINQYPVHRFPDLARLPEHQEKILKAFGEGRDAQRQKTDILAEGGEGDVDDQVLECPHTVIAFIATDNENVDLDDFPEIRNRALVVSVDASEEQTKAVNLRKAKERAGSVEEFIEPMRRAQIQNYHANIPVDEWVKTPGNKILNPAAEEIHAQEPIPQKFPEARQDFDRLLEFMETVALYHYSERVVTETGGGNRVMLVAPVDIWLAMTILGNKMVMSALNLQREDRAIIDLLNDTSSNLTKSDIQQSLRGQGFNITDRDVRRSLKSMREKGYVIEHNGNPNHYSLSPFASVTKHDVGIDYDAIADSAADKVGGIVGDGAAEAYIENFTTGDGLMTTHPFTGRAVDITTDSTLEEMLDTGVTGLEEAMGSQGSAGPDEDDDAQVTL